jgi:hypothetical protein
MVRILYFQQLRLLAAVKVDITHLILVVLVGQVVAVEHQMLAVLAVLQVHQDKDTLVVHLQEQTEITVAVVAVALVQ